MQPGNDYGEVVIGAIPLRRMKSFGRYDSYVGVVTNCRLIIAELTKQMINDSITKARKDAKAQGKGYMGQMSSQMREHSSGYTSRFLSMSPSSILAETPGNFELSNGSISEIRLTISYHDEDSVKDEFDVEIYSGGARYNFVTDGSGDYTNLLKSVFGDRFRRR